MGEKMSRAGEDYLEAILELSEENSHVRSVDVANRLGVTRPSVNKAVKVLKEAGMIEQQHYGTITLTSEGAVLAQEVLGRHKLLKHFLRDLLGVEDIVAEDEACRMEHILSADTLQKLSHFIDGMQKQ